MRDGFVALFFQNMGQMNLTRQDQKKCWKIVDKHIDVLEDKNEVQFDCFGIKSCIKGKYCRNSNKLCFEVKDDCIYELTGEGKQRAHLYEEKNLRFVIRIQQFGGGKLKFDIY